MDEPDDLERACELMQPGVISLHGFLGSDPRKLAEILAEDDAEVERLGLTHGEIARRLDHFTLAALGGYGSPRSEGDCEVVIVETRGHMRCPFGERGFFRKGEVRLTNARRGQALVWTPLLVHLVGEHGFYEGRGSPYRLEPAALKSVLGLSG